MDKKLYKLMDWGKIEEVVYSECDNPVDFLGAHKVKNQVLVQCYFSDALKVMIEYLDKEQKKEIPMELVDEAGFFAVLLPTRKIPNYRFHVTYSTLYCEDETKEAFDLENTEDYEIPNSHRFDEDKMSNSDLYEESYTKIIEDPYRFKSLFTKEDLIKFQHGIHYTIYEKLGAHPTTIDGISGTHFAVWAPNCVRVSVVGTFNKWDGRIHQMNRLEDSGIFELFIPEVAEGELYKFELKLRSGLTYLKSDPYGSAFELRPDNAGIVTNIENFPWEDQGYIKNRSKTCLVDKPMSIYELHLGSFMKSPEGGFLNYKELAAEIIRYVKKMHYTHVEIMPVMEHPLDESWGYQVIGYYAPTSRYGTPQDFMYFINELHKANIGVILDWVPAHFPRDTHGLSCFDGTCLYEHADPRQGSHPHWGTLIYNYGRKEVSNYLIANGLYWVEKFHADGIRMDAVASMLYLDYGKQEGQWIPNIYGGNENLEAIEFIKHFNSILKKRNPGVLSIAEESTAFPMVTGSLNHDGLGFDYKWNMGFMNDYLGYIRNDPYFRSYHHGELTFSMIYAYSEKFVSVFSHDEVVHGKATMLGKMPGAVENKYEQLRLTYGYLFAHPGKKLLFMGQDLGEFDEWNEKRQIQWELEECKGHCGIQLCVEDLNQLYLNHKALYELDHTYTGFQWMNHLASNACYVSFARYSKDKDETLLVVANFSGINQEITTGVPAEGKYKEIFNSDSVKYGGTGFINPRMKAAKCKSCDDQDYSLTVRVAKNSISILKLV